MADDFTLPPPSTEGLRGLAQTIRAQHHDPENRLWHHPDGKPMEDRIAADELRLASLLQSAGVVAEVARSPQQQAMHDFELRFPNHDNPQIEALIGSLTLAQEAKGPEGMIRAASALRGDMGFANYDALVALAGGGLPAGKVLSPAHKADPHILKLFAAKAQYNAARDRARPRS
jgi:hypothetical protein